MQRRIRIEEHDDGLSRRVTLQESVFSSGIRENWQTVAELDVWIIAIHLNSDGSATMDFRTNVDVDVVRAENIEITRSGDE